MASTTITDTLNPLAFKQEFVPLVRALRNLLRTLWSTKGRQTLTLLTVAIVIVICATVAAQVALNAWNRVRLIEPNKALPVVRRSERQFELDALCGCDL